MEKVRLGDLSTVVRGSSPRPQGDLRYYKGPVPRLMVADLTRDGMYVTPLIDSLTIEGATKSRPMKKGDFVIAVSGDAGQPCILNIDACIHDGFVGLRELDESRIFKPFLFHFMMSIKLQNSLLAVGAIYKNLNTDQIKDIQIPLPSLEEQKRIATLLDKADELRQKDKALLQKYDALAQSLFLEMFGDPVTNEMGWEKKSLKNVTSKIGSGSTPSGGKESYFASGTSLIRSLNVHDRKFKMKDLAFIDDSQASKLKNVIVESNDILFNITGASVCRCTIVPDEILPARVNQHVSILRAITEILNPEFLCFQIISDNVKRNLYSIATQGGATREAITKDQLEMYEVICPPIELQNQFAEQIKLIEAQKLLVQQNLEKSEGLFLGLLGESFK